MKNSAVRKKSVFMLLFLILIVSALTGCTDSEESESGKNDDGSLSMTYWVVNNKPDVLKNYNEMAAYKKLQEVTGVKVKFEHPASGEADQQFNLMMASGKLPDVIEKTWTAVPGGPQKYIKDNKIVKLNDYIDEHAPNLKQILEKHPEWKKMISTDDGSIYAFPFIREDDVNLTFYGPVLRKDWLGKLGLDTPETIDEWHTVLTAIKDKDPNGNGKADEIPFIIDNSGSTGNAFVGAWGITNGFYQVDNVVKYGPIQPEYKEYLTLMKDWYAEGLIDNEYIATDDKLKTAKVMNDQLGAFMGYTGSSILRFMQLKKEEDPDFKLTGAPYPVYKKGDIPYFNLGEKNYMGVGAAISTSNKNIVETVKWLDYKYGEEGFNLFNFGIEGESYEMIDGYPTYKDIITNNPDGKPMVEVLGMFVPVGSGPYIQAKEYAEQYTSMPAQQEAIAQWKKGSNERLMPIVTPLQEESSEYASIMNDISTYKAEMINKFIMGEEPLSKFDEFAKTINAMGLERAIEIQQSALERYNKR